MYKTRLADRATSICAASMLAALACELPEDSSIATLESAATVCAQGETVQGIDVSKWQGSIDWTAVAATEVEFAYIRVSDGAATPDAQFQNNWSGAYEAGLIRGAYQYFRPKQDPIAQAELLLSKIGGTVQPGELPPVLDIESTSGLSGQAVVNAASLWLEHVESSLGVRPVIYTYASFWNNQIDSDAFASYPLWIAHFGPPCPNLPDAWTDWQFFQRSATGSVDGIDGDVDLDEFNGSLEELLEYTNHTPGEFGCTERVSSAGGIIDDDGPCFEAGGNPAYVRVADAGYGGSLQWTHTTDFAAPSNYGTWTISVEDSGRYQVEAYTAASHAQSRAARYTIEQGSGTSEIVIDQTRFDGWSPLGTFDFSSNAASRIRLDDNTGEPNASHVQLVFDAIRLTRVGSTPSPSPPQDEPEEDVEDELGGCRQAGGPDALAHGLVVLVLVAGPLRRRRRGRRSTGDKLG